ncbi:MAG: IMP dehydrogenase [Candidatus Aenigmatarchaeota archaeon]
MVKLHPKLNGKEFSFADVIVNEGFSELGTNEIKTDAQFTKKLRGKIPLISAPMDTVTESRLAIALANQGGLPVIHNNFPSDNNSTGIEKQVKEIEITKRWRSGFIEHPYTTKPDTPIEEADNMMKKHCVGSVIVTDNGDPHGTLVGILTKNSYSLQAVFGGDRGMHAGLKVRDRMVPFERTRHIQMREIEQGDQLKNAYIKLLESHWGMAPIIDENGKVCYVVSRRDLAKSTDYPNAVKDKKGRLVVFGAIGTHKADYERLDALIAAGADGICIETSHAYKKFVFDMLSHVKQSYPELEVMVGNTTNNEAVKRLIELGADAIKIGIGPGSICITRSDLGIGRPQLSAIYNARLVADGMKEEFGKVPIIGDGGFTGPGTLLKGLALGADAIMSGNLLAGTEEAPGEYVYSSSGVRVKKYRGMGSRESMDVNSGLARGGRSLAVPEGVTGYVEDRGPVGHWIPYLIEGLKKAMEKAGAGSIEELYQNAEILPHPLGGQEEGKPHNLVSYMRSQ